MANVEGGQHLRALRIVDAMRDTGASGYAVWRDEFGSTWHLSVQTSLNTGVELRRDHKAVGKELSSAAWRLDPHLVWRVVVEEPDALS